MTKELIEEAREFLQSENAQYYDSSLIKALADALEARQPTEDGEYMLKLIDTVKGTRSSVEIAGVKIMPCDEYGRIAAVPDAATEREIAIIEEHREKWMARAFRAEAERDAALAAVERIRQAVSGHPECDRYEEGDVISCGWKSAYASVVAALDGAPEPEWEYQWGEPGESFEGFDTFATEELARAEMELDSDYPSHRVMRRRKAGPWEACNE